MKRSIKMTTIQKLSSVLILIFILILILVFLPSCNGSSSDHIQNMHTLEVVSERPNISSGNSLDSSRLPLIRSWAYQLQDTDFDELKNLNTDLIVIDIDDSRFTRKQIEELKKEKVVLSYLSIGEAESYRSYWNDNWEPGNPAFIDSENPDWNENYKVKYWYEDWQDIMISQLDKIIQKGYSGSYFDIIDAYEHYLHFSSVQSKKAMVDFVIRLSKYARSKDPDFLIFVQNAPELFLEPEYFAVIDGVGKEDTWYLDDKKIQPESLSYLSYAFENDKIVLVIDYPSKKENICDFFEKAESYGFIPYSSNRELDKLSSNNC